MPTPKYLLTTYTSANDALTTIDNWLVNVMGYYRNLPPTSDTVKYTGNKAHYQYTFQTGETIYLNFHTDTANSKLYLTCSSTYSSSLAWNAQTNTATVLSGGVVSASIVIPTTASNNALYLFGDNKGNFQVFVQRGSTISLSDFMQWGVLNKSGFGSWTGGQYFSAYSLATATLTAGTLTYSDPGPYLQRDSYSSHTPYGAIYVTVDGNSAWAAIKAFMAGTSSNAEPSSTIGVTSGTWSSIIVGSCVCDSYEQRDTLPTAEEGSYGGYGNPHYYISNTVEILASGYVHCITGKISLGPNQVIYARHESTQRVSPIGRVPFGYHCPIAGYYQYVAPGTQLVQDGRTFMFIGNIAAEMVSV